MHTVFFKYVLPKPVPRAEMLEKFQASEPMFRGLPNLIRKQYGYDEETHTGYSVYTWESEAAARAFYNDNFLAHFRKTFGTEPELLFIDTLFVVDNGEAKNEAA